MGVLSIKIRIGDRDYPMKVDESEEEMLRMAGKMLNERLRSFREQYQIDNTQDLLAMLAFDGLVNELKNKQTAAQTENQLAERINYINSIISKSLAH